MASAHLPHGEEHEEAAGLYVLGLLEEPEAGDFERHLAVCGRCSELVRQDRDTLGRLAVAAPERDASPGLKARLLDRAAAELRAQARDEPPEPDPLPLAQRRDRRSRRWAAWAAPLAAALVLAIGGGIYLQRQVEGSRVVAAVPLAGAGAPGTAVVVVRQSQQAELVLQLAPPPAGRVYEAWIIPPGGAPIPAGTSASGTDALALGRPVLGTTVAVTVESPPGVPAPTSQPILAAEVERP